jgi:proteasome lid subunit RPN8/RPN11
MGVKTEIHVLDAVREHGRARYPEECCGFLLGHLGDDGGKTIVAAERAENVRAQNRERRYTISPQDYLAADRDAQRRGLDIVGFYHSHPDHPARPSATDLEEATFPEYVYVINSVNGGEPGDLTAWSLASDRSEFVEEIIDII